MTLTGGPGGGAAAGSSFGFRAGGGAAEEERRKTLVYQFTQQRLRAWQPILTPRYIIPLYLICGAAFVGLGVVLLLTSWSVVEVMHDYTDAVTDSDRVGSFEITIERDMEPPIWLHYELSGFYQNHRRYVKSYDTKQLHQAESAGTSKQALHRCEPVVQDAGGRVLYPCGLVARSVFNDSYVLLRGGPGEEGGWSRVSVDSEAESIAWGADMNGKFRNIDPERWDSKSGLPLQVALNMWILQRFPPVECEQRNFSGGTYAPVSVATRLEPAPPQEGSPGAGRFVEVADCSGYMGDQPACNFTRGGLPFSCEGAYEQVRRRSWGIESGHLIVWMRIAGLPTFRKLWGKVDTPLKAGTSVKVFVNDNFPVKEFHGRKAFVLSTSSILGGRNDFLGYGYVVVGSCCLAFGICKLLQCLYCPRPLGDISFLTPQR